MIPLPHYRGAQIGVLGLGPQGSAVVDALVHSGANVVAWDGDTARQDGCSVSCTPPRDWRIADLDGVVLADGSRDGVARGVAEAAKLAGVPIMTDVDLFGEAMDQLAPAERGTVIAVTGVAGKSVTVSIISHILREQGRKVAIGGQLGAPLMSLPTPDPDVTYVLELPVHRLVRAPSLICDIAVVLNVSELPFPGPLDMAVNALARVFQSGRVRQTAIIGMDDAMGQKLCTALRSVGSAAKGVRDIIPVSGEAALSHGVFALDNSCHAALRGGAQLLGDFSRASAFAGPHLNQDVAAAAAVCLSMDIRAPMIIKALHSYQGLAGRFECLGAAGPVTFVDDAYASTAAATARAIGSCPDVFWVGGNPDMPDRLAGTPTGLGSVHGTYVVQAGADGHAHEDLETAVAAAVCDAEALLAKDPAAAPVVLFSPGVPPGKASFRRSAFRAIAAEYIDGRAEKYA